jgi:SAM-dependent methyltransferase
MQGFTLSTYGDRWAEVYDEWFEHAEETQEAVQFLWSFVRGGTAFELGVGTGRIALPLADRGVSVRGIESSEQMIQRLRTKPGSDRVQVEMGDFAEIDTDSTYSLIYCVFSSLWCLPTQERQVLCFENVGKHLDTDGVFVVDTFIPDVTRYTENERTATTRITVDEVRLETTIHDPLAQRLDSHSVVVREDGMKLFPLSLRYVWPAEMDLMAMIAGLELKDRWGGWMREPFTASSEAAISVYSRKA